MVPLQPSPFNPGAAIITREVRAAFLEYTGLRERLVLALERMLQFYGLGLNPTYSRAELASMSTPPDPTPENSSEEQGDDPAALVGKSANFSRRAAASWLKRSDHNHLRITRIIRCLRVLGLEVLAKAVYEALLDNDEDEKVSARSRMFWRRAAERELWLAPSDEDDAEGVKWLRDELTGDEEGEQGQ